MRATLVALAFLVLPSFAFAQQYIELTPDRAATAPLPNDDPAPSLDADVLDRLSKGVLVLERLDADGRSLGPASAFLDPRGLIVTNRHCIEGAYSMALNLGALGLFKLPTLVCENQTLDIAMLNGDFPIASLVPLQWASSEPLSSHAPVSVVVRDGDGRITASPGWTDGLVFDKSGALLQATTAAAWYGCSGSPLVNERGQVIGVVNRLGNSQRTPPYRTTARAATAADILALTIDNPMPFSIARPSDPAAREFAHSVRRWAFRSPSRDMNSVIDLHRSAAGMLPHSIDTRFSLVDLLEYQPLIEPSPKKPPSVQAESELASILADNADDPIAFLYAGHRHLRKQNYPDAIAAYAKSITVRPTAVAFYWLADSYWRQRDHASAAAALEEAVKLEPRCTQCWTSLAQLYENLGKHDRVVRIVSHQLDTTPNDPQLLANLAIAQRRAGDTAQQHATIERLRTINHYLANRAELLPADHGKHLPPYQTP